MTDARVDSSACNRSASEPPWKHPGSLAFAANLFANSRLARSVGRRLPSATMASDITDAVYVNYLLPADRLEAFTRTPLTLQRLGPGGRHGLFTILTFRHGHFGPACFGRFRSLWPSPIQSNWRIHVENPATGTRGIQFLTTAITSTPHALATRLLADGVPMHVPRSAKHAPSQNGVIRVAIEPGHGSAPDLRATFAPAAEPAMEGPWKDCFASWREMLAYCVPQDRAMTVARSRVVRQEINLGIPLESCVPLTGEIDSHAARAIAGDAKPLCFMVPSVKFSFSRQEWDE